MMDEVSKKKSIISVLVELILSTLFFLPPINAFSFEEVTWTWAGVGIPELTVQDIAPSRQGPRCFALTDQAVYLSEDHGGSWARIFRLPSIITQAPADRYDQGSETDSRPAVDIEDLDELKRLGIVEDWVEDFEEIEEDLTDLVERAGYRVAEEFPETGRRTTDESDPETVAASAPNRILWLEDSKLVLLISKSGIFISSDDGKNWKEILLGLGKPGSFATSLAGSKTRLLIGTDSGLYQSFDSGSSWSLVSAAQSSRDDEIVAISGITRDPAKFLVASPRSISILGPQNDLVQVLTATGRGLDRIIDCTAVTETDWIALYPDKVLRSPDAGASWAGLSGLGLPSGAIRRSGWLRDERLGNAIIVYGDRGIFYFDSNARRWQALNKGLRVQAVSSVWWSEQAPVTGWLAAVEGIFRAGIGPEVASRVMQSAVPGWDNAKARGELATLYSLTMKNAFIDPQEIYRWHSRAASRCWLPEADLSFRITDGMNTGEDNGTIIEITDEGIVIGPDDYSYSRDDDLNYSVKLDLKWFPGELFFNKASVDVARESRKIALLRKKLLDRAAKLYIRRSQLIQAQASSDSGDLLRSANQLLELDEVNAQLNMLMGGSYFTSSAVAGQQPVESEK